MNRRAYAQNLAYLAAQFVGRVHDDSPEAIRQGLVAMRAATPPAGIDVDDAIAVTLAAMVDPERTPRDLIAWTTRLDGNLGDLYPGRQRVYRANPLAVAMGVQGVLPACALNPAEQVEVVHTLRGRMSTEQIADHLDVEPHEVRRWAGTHPDTTHTISAA